MVKIKSKFIKNIIIGSYFYGTRTNIGIFKLPGAIKCINTVLRRNIFYFMSKGTHTHPRYCFVANTTHESTILFILVMNLRTIFVWWILCMMCNGYTDFKRWLSFFYPSLHIWLTTLQHGTLLKYFQKQWIHQNSLLPRGNEYEEGVQLGREKLKFLHV